jgi:hypothetical protein
VSRQIGDPEEGHAVAGVKVDDAVRRAVMVCIDRLNAEVEKVAGCLKPAPFADMGAFRNPPPVNKNSSSKVEIDSTAEIRRSAVIGAMSKASAVLCKYQDFHTMPLTLESLVVILCISYV